MIKAGSLISLSFLHDSLQIGARKNAANFRVSCANFDEVNAIIINKVRFCSKLKEQFNAFNFPGESCFDEWSLSKSAESIWIGAILKENLGNLQCQAEIKL